MTKTRLDGSPSPCWTSIRKTWIICRRQSKLSRMSRFLQGTDPAFPTKTTTTKQLSRSSPDTLPKAGLSVTLSDDVRCLRNTVTGAPEP